MTIAGFSLSLLSLASLSVSLSLESPVPLYLYRYDHDHDNIILQSRFSTFYYSPPNGFPSILKMTFDIKKASTKTRTIHHAVIEYCSHNTNSWHMPDTARYYR
jgi:hypothetical protein